MPKRIIIAACIVILAAFIVFSTSRMVHDFNDESLDKRIVQIG